MFVTVPLNAEDLGCLPVFILSTAGAQRFFQDHSSAENNNYTSFRLNRELGQSMWMKLQTGPVDFCPCVIYQR